MPEEVQYVYVASTTSDVPWVDRYVLVARLQSGIRVKQRGHVSTIRQANGRQFFFSRDDLASFFQRHVAAKLEAHTNAVRKCVAALADGVTVFPIPDEAPPPPKKGWLDD